MRLALLSRRPRDRCGAKSKDGTRLRAFGFRAYRAWGFGFRVWVLGFRVKGLGLGV